MNFEEFITTYPPSDNTKTPLIDIALGVPEGSRNTDATSIVGSLLVRYEPELWEFVVWPLFKAWNLTCNPPQDEKVIRSMYERFSKQELSKRAQLPVASYKSQYVMQHNQLQKYTVLQFTDEELQHIIQADHIEDLATEDGATGIEWFWKGYIARGLKTELSAFWKAGKTTLIIELLRSLVSGQPFVGLETKKIKVYLISEETKIAWIDRRIKKELKGFDVKCKPFKRKLNRIEWERYLEKLATECKEKSYNLVIFDTLSDFWPVFKEEDAIDVKDALRPLNYLTEAGLGVLLVHHSSRKGEREGGMGRGSGALPADVDIIVDLVRFDPGNDHDNRRILKGGNSRFDETPRELVIQLTDTGYAAVGGSKAEVFKEENLQTLLAMLPESPKNTTVGNLIENWQGDGKVPDKGTFSRWLNILEKRGEAGRVSQGGNKPDLWHQCVAPQTINGATQSENEANSVALQVTSNKEATQPTGSLTPYDELSSRERYYADDKIVEKYQSKISVLGVPKDKVTNPNYCLWCGELATNFKDELSIKEFGISGLCQVCQDKSFKNSPEPKDKNEVASSRAVVTQSVDEQTKQTEDE